MYYILLPCSQIGSPYEKAKRLRVLADVSGSMYRFNGVDGRLERSMEAVCMVMEALEGFEHKFKVKVQKMRYYIIIDLPRSLSSSHCHCNSWTAVVTSQSGA